MTDEQIEAMTLLQMKRLIRRLERARFARAHQLWVETFGNTSHKVGEFVRFRDEQEGLGR